ncbi:MAG: phage tail protein [Actinomycetota bacterium]|nr:phage tail protein [Actinomycetota bacterium]
MSHDTLWYAVLDCKVDKITADAVGGTTTYAAAFDVPGIKSVGLGGDVEVKEARGDNTLLSKRSFLQSISGTVEHARLSLDVLAMMLGAAVADTGVTPNRVATMGLLGTHNFNYWRLRARTPTGGIDTLTGAGYLTAWRCILSSFPDIGMVEEDFATVSFEFEAGPRFSDSKWIDTEVQETATVLA